MSDVAFVGVPDECAMIPGSSLPQREVAKTWSNPGGCSVINEVQQKVSTFHVCARHWISGELSVLIIRKDVKKSFKSIKA